MSSLVAQMVKRLPAMRETQVQFLGWEDPLEKEMAIHSSTLAWKIPWTEEPDRLQSMGSQRVRHDWTTSLHFKNRKEVFMWLNGKESACNTGHLGLIPGSGKTPGEGNGNPLQYSCLKNHITEEPGRLRSMGSQRVGHDWATSLMQTCLWALLTLLPYYPGIYYSDKKSVEISW